MLRWRSRLIRLSLAFLALLAANAFARTPVQLTAATSQVPLAPYTRFFHDETGKDDLTAARARLAAGGFQPIPGDNPSFGFQDGAYWFHVQVGNQGSAEDKWLLTQEYALSDRIDLYATYADGRVVHTAGGDHLPFAQRLERRSEAGPRFVEDERRANVRQLGYGVGARLGLAGQAACRQLPCGAVVQLAGFVAVVRAAL